MPSKGKAPGSVFSSVGWRDYKTQRVKVAGKVFDWGRGVGFEDVLGHTIVLTQRTYGEL